MSKIRFHDIDQNEKYKIIGELFELISRLKNKKEVVDFFIGLLTQSESLMMARRIQIAKQILEEKTYEEIRSNLKVGFSTIQKTEQWINGGWDDYKKWITGIIVKTNLERDNFKNLLDKYPNHRIWKKLLS